MECISVHCGYRVAFYHMHFCCLCLSNYLSILLNKRRHANDFQNGEKWNMAATFHMNILSYIMLKLKFEKYPAIYTYYMSYHGTTEIYTVIIIGLFINGEK